MNTTTIWNQFAAGLTSDHFQNAQCRVLRQLIKALLFERVLVPEMTKKGPNEVWFYTHHRLIMRPAINCYRRNLCRL